MTRKEYIEQKAKELAAKKAKDAITPGVTVTETKEAADVAQRKQFYKSFIEKDRDGMRKISEEVAKEYKTKGRSVAVNADGGYLVPIGIADSIIQKRTQLSGFRRLATSIANLPAQFDLPTEATKPTAYWVAEGAPITESKSTFGRKRLTLNKIAGLVTFTYESLKDTASNPSLQNLVEQQLAFVITQEENNAIVNGDGSGKPFGFRSSDITPITAAQNGDTLSYTDLTSLRRKLPAGYRQFGIFVTSSSGALAMENVRDGNNRPIWRDGLTEDSPTRVLGRPVVEVDEIPATLGTGSDETEIWYMDPSFYYLGTGEAMRVDWGTSDDDFDRDQVKLRVIDRIAGRPTIDEAFAKLTAVKG